ncbi:type II secretion system protein GspC [Thioalkalivibrio sulfidiphilus]|uniref:type II secretion system protein GspC n=1 Tax=Thioalkalivibrio sulfidiphilus TaxID=1033854 RepID=UPI0003736814|nr:type II secretion system protein GspC [Thioalkalivibrio sulfidiphilus]
MSLAQLPMGLATRFQERVNVTRLAGWVTVFLILLLAYALARLTWALLAPAPLVLPAPMVAPTQVAAAGSAESPAASALARVAGLHLFGQAEVRDEAAVAVPVDTPDTRLNLSLKGVVAATPVERGIALIADERGNERHYAVGAELPGGATLEQVHGDRVVLRRAGRFEQLRLPRDAPLSGEAPAVLVPEPMAQPGSQPGSIPEATRQQWLQDPRTLFDMVQAQPVMQDGSIRGFAISPRRDARAFRQAGLRPGDVVTSINGVTIAGMTDPAAMMEQLAGATELRLDIERNGRPESVVIQVGP